MATTDPDAQRQCREHLDHFFVHYRSPELERSCRKAFRFLAALDEPLRGKPEGWAAGIVYAVASRYCRPCGVPGILNADFEQFFGVSRSTIRKRSGQVDQESDT